MQRRCVFVGTNGGRVPDENDKRGRLWPWPVGMHDLIREYLESLPWDEGGEMVQFERVEDAEFGERVLITSGPEKGNSYAVHVLREDPGDPTSATAVEFSCSSGGGLTLPIDLLRWLCGALVELQVAPRPTQLPPHANAEVHKKIMADLKAMSPEAFKASLVQAGICTPDGVLVNHYAADVEESYVEAKIRAWWWCMPPDRRPKQVTLVEVVEEALKLEPKDALHLHTLSREVSVAMARLGFAKKRLTLGGGRRVNVWVPTSDMLTGSVLPEVVS